MTSSNDLLGHMYWVMSVAQKWLTVLPQLRSRSTRVVDAMVADVKVLQRDATYGDVVEFFADDHVHMALIVHDEQVLTAIDRSDLATDLDPRERAIDVGTLTGRWVGPLEDLLRVQERMIRTSRRRLVVLGDAGQFLGLLCLKRHGQGFCRDEDVLARQANSLS